MMSITPEQKTYLKEAFLHWHIVALVTVVAFIAPVLIYVAAGKPAGQIPVVGGDTFNTVPATGVNGYNLAGFCQDPRTAVTGPMPAPDVTGNLYTLARVLDSKPESATVIIANDAVQSITFAKHYYEVNKPQPDGTTKVEQDSEDAFIDESSRACIANRCRTHTQGTFICNSKAN